MVFASTSYVPQSGPIIEQIGDLDIVTIEEYSDDDDTGNKVAKGVVVMGVQNFEISYMCVFCKGSIDCDGASEIG